MQVFVLLGIGVFWAIRDFRRDDENRFRHSGWIILLGGSYLLYALCLPFTDKSHQRDVLFGLEQKASLLALPIVFLFLHSSTRKAITDQVIFFAFSCFIACLAANVCYVLHHDWYTTNPFAHVVYRRYFNTLTEIHPTYMGLYLCFAIAILLWTPGRHQRLEGWQLGVVLFPLFVFIMALMPKTPVAALFVLFLYYAWTTGRQKSKLIPVATALVLALSVSWTCIPFTRQRLAELSGFINTASDRDPINNSINMRQIILDIDLKLLNDNWVTGLGPGYLDDVLDSEYKDYSHKLHLSLDTFNTHNEYLNQWLSFGLAGIVIFLLIFTVQAIQAIRQRNHLYVALLLILSITFSTENVLSMQDGVVFYAFFASLFFFNGLRRQKERKPTPIPAEKPILTTVSKTRFPEPVASTARIRLQ